MQLPLTGIRVIDLTIWQHGPYATALLADLGADVVKVEERASGDPGRYFAVARDLELSSYFEAHNRGKRSLALDLKQPAGRDVLLRLAASADIFLTNFRIGAVRRLGLDYEALRAANPRIVYVQASGFGPAGDEATRARSTSSFRRGAASQARTASPTTRRYRTQTAIADQVGAMHACIAALAGRRRPTRLARARARHVAARQHGVAAVVQPRRLPVYGQAARAVLQGGTRPFWRIYQGGDGAWFVIGMLLDRAWPEMCARHRPAGSARRSALRHVTQVAGSTTRRR